MTTVRKLVAAGGGLIALLLAGCGPGPKDLQIQSLTEEVNRLTAEKQDLLGQFQRAQSERDDARNRALDLRQQLASLQNELARARETATRVGRWHEARGIAWTDIADNILFDSGRAKLKPQGREELRKIADEIRQRYPDRQVWIVGHTDSDPIKVSGWKDNLELSVQRACTVFRELQQIGLDPDRMVAAGQGEHHPKAPNEPRTKHLNRRVQIVAIDVPETSRIEEPAERG